VAVTSPPSLMLAGCQTNGIFFSLFPLTEPRLPHLYPVPRHISPFPVNPSSLIMFSPPFFPELRWCTTPSRVFFPPPLHRLLPLSPLVKPCWTRPPVCTGHATNVSSLPHRCVSTHGEGFFCPPFPFWVFLGEITPNVLLSFIEGDRFGADGLGSP